MMGIGPFELVLVFPVLAVAVAAWLIYRARRARRAP